MTINKDVINSLLKYIKNSNNPHEEIPESVIRISHKRMNSNTKIVLSVIYTMFIEGRHFMMSNGYIAQKTGLSKGIVTKSISLLVKNNWIKTKLNNYTNSGTRREVISLNLYKIFNIKSDDNIFANEKAVRTLFKEANKLNLLGVNRGSENSLRGVQNNLAPSLEHNNGLIEKNQCSSHKKVGTNKVVNNSRDRLMDDNPGKKSKSKNEKLPYYKDAKELCNKFSAYLHGNDKLIYVFSQWLTDYTKGQISQAIIKTINEHGEKDDIVGILNPVNYSHKILTNNYLNRYESNKINKKIRAVVNKRDNLHSLKYRNNKCKTIKRMLNKGNVKVVTHVLSLLTNVDKRKNYLQFISIYLATYFYGISGIMSEQQFRNFTPKQQISFVMKFTSNK